MWGRVGLAVCVCAAMVGDGRAVSIAAAANPHETAAEETDALPSTTKEGTAAASNTSLGRKVIG